MCVAFKYEYLIRKVYHCDRYYNAFENISDNGFISPEVEKLQFFCKGRHNPLNGNINTEWFVFQVTSVSS